MTKHCTTGSGFVPWWMAALMVCRLAGAVTFTNDTLIGPGDSQYDGADIVVSNCVLTLDGSHWFSNVRVATGGIVTHPLSAGGLNLSVTGDMEVERGGRINADGGGYPASLGPGAGHVSLQSGYRGGGGYGGLGGANFPAGGETYGYIQRVGLTGSGGANGTNALGNLQLGGSGGGAVRLSVGRTLALNGTISANGSAGGTDSGGGSGGSVSVMCESLTGQGTVSANGGPGNGLGGGGGGGRIVLNYTSNLFSGLLTAAGGGGVVGGGAGTIYQKADNQPVGELLVSNHGLAGTNTPLSFDSWFPNLPFDLTVRGNAAVYFPGAIPLLSNLVVDTGSRITSLPQTNLDLAILRDARFATGGAIVVDGKGYPRANGPGAGATYQGDGGGGGYGGAGGNSFLGAAGGSTYGSATQPIDWGSGGGWSWSESPGGSEGGGAVRLTVGGTLLVDGRLGADGNPGSTEDASGGGAGGSIWVTAGAITGEGVISAKGGQGGFWGGGCGGGGRIAIYSSSNSFSGFISVAGGSGPTAGIDGTYYASTNAPVLAVISQTPTGVVTNGVKSVDLVFNTLFNPFTASASDVIVQTPAGNIPEGNIAASTPSTTTLRIQFPLQTLPGEYTARVGPQIEDLLGFPMSQAYTGTFSIALPVVQGRVTDTNGLPVPGVTLQASAGFGQATTDENGNYLLGFVPGYAFTVTPSLSNFVFIPGSRSYTSLMASVTNADFMALALELPILTAGLQGTNLLLNWHGVPGASYQIYTSTNLLDWSSYGMPITGSNAPLQISLPIEGDRMKYFRLQAGG